MACGLSWPLPRIGLGMWNGFGAQNDERIQRALLRLAIDRGAAHFDLANVYGPPHGAAETCLGRHLKGELRGLRDQIIISTKAGMPMWPGPYGSGGSRKHIVASLDQSLARLGVDYIDIFYSHRFDPTVSIEETMEALASLVRSGKARAIGISNYTPAQTAQAARLLRGAGVPLAVNQFHYSMFHRQPEEGESSLLAVLAREGVAGIAYSPLEQGLLTTRYLHGIPPGSRVARDLPGWYFIGPNAITEEYRSRIRALSLVATGRGQDLAGLALAWIFRREEMRSVVVGASSVEQFTTNLDAATVAPLTAKEILAIEEILSIPAVG